MENTTTHNTERTKVTYNNDQVILTYAEVILQPHPHISTKVWNAYIFTWQCWRSIHSFPIESIAYENKVALDFLMGGGGREAHASITWVSEVSNYQVIKEHSTSYCKARTDWLSPGLRDTTRTAIRDEVQSLKNHSYLRLVIRMSTWCVYCAHLFSKWFKKKSQNKQSSLVGGGRDNQQRHVHPFLYSIQWI